MEIPFCLIIGLILVCFLGLMIRRLRRFFLIALALLVVADLAIFLMTPQFPRRLQTAMSTNVATTSDTPEFPELKTRIYHASPAQVLHAAGLAIQSLPNWKLITSDPLTETIHAEKKVAIYTDDVTVHLTPHDSATRVDVTSHSRVGKGDFGENRRHIAQLLWNLDRRF